MPKWVYPLGFAFLLFYIYNDATGAGIAGRGFVNFLSTLLDAVGDFVSAFSSAGDQPAAVDPQAPTVVPTTTVQTTLPPATGATVPETLTLTTPTTTP